MPLLRLLCLALMLAIPTVGAAQKIPEKPYEVIRLAEGVYALQWKDPVQSPVEGNSLFIINDRDVVVVDAGYLPVTARRMARALKQLTSKPVRYVINTHWHDDHHNGNQVYRELWPAVEFIAHRDTRVDMYEGTYNVRAQDVANLRSGAERYRRWASTGKDDEGKPLEPRRQARAAELAGLLAAMAPEIASVRTTPPDLTFDDQIVLHRGDRTIEIRWLGRGNTRGDVVVFLPRERIVASGDLVVQPVPFAFGSYYEDWIGTLGRLDSLEADVIVPGHGGVQRDRTYLRQVQGLLRSLVDQVKVQVDAGATLEETRAKVTLAEWRDRFAGDNPRLQESFQTNFVNPAVERAWRQAKGEPGALKGVE